MGREVRVGIALHADLEFLELTAGIAEGAEIVEVTPETLWRPEGGRLVANGFHGLLAERIEGWGIPCVAHGVEYSVGSPGGEALEARTEAWLGRIREDHARFGFRWYTEHLGYCQTGDWLSMFPLPLPRTERVAGWCAERLGRLRGVVERVGVENQVDYLWFGKVEEAPRLHNALVGRGFGTLLDLHNVLCDARNGGVEPEAILAEVDLRGVWEIHVAGGTPSEPGWTEGRGYWLDGHDGEVPEEVWELLRWVVPRCPNLEAVIVERMTGTLDAERARVYADEVERAKREVAACGRGVEPHAASSTLGVSPVPEEALLAGVLEGLVGVDPSGALEALRGRGEAWEEALAGVDRLGWRLTGLLAAKQRLTLLLQGSSTAEVWFQRDAREFTGVFEAYRAAVPPRVAFPQEEAARFEDWLLTSADCHVGVT